MKEQVLKIIRDRIAEMLVKNKWPLLDVTSGAYTEEVEAEIAEEHAKVIEALHEQDVSGLDKLALLSASAELQIAMKAADLDAKARKAKLAEIRKHLSKGETALIADEEDEDDE